MPPTRARVIAAGLGLVAFLAHLMVTFQVHRFGGSGAGLLFRLVVVPATAAVPLLVFARLVARPAARPATFRVERAPDRFVVSAFAQLPGMQAIMFMWLAATFVQTESTPDGERVRLAGDTGAVISVVAVVLLFAVSVALLLWWRVSVVLDPDGITISRFRRPVTVRWDDLSPGGPPAPARVAPRDVPLFYRDWRPDLGPPRAEQLPVGLLDVAPAFLTTAIRQYVEQPGLRTKIGTPGELDRLRAAAGESRG
ncbi:hypothetical protein [Plantactinospora sp. B5E13]|uniref:hypothetical protein n=1 Tax=Plantactinospora sp. B5E13 TaxID=3153758 RepID=UPI00325E13D2